MKLTRYERETIINFNSAEKEATVSTSDRTVMRKLDALAAEFPDKYLILSKDDYSTTYLMPKSFINYRRPRMISDEARERVRQRMLELNKRQLMGKNDVIGDAEKIDRGSLNETSSDFCGDSNGREL